MVIHNERGAFLIPLLLLTTLVAVTGFGIWGVMRSWKKQAEIQLRLDECVGKKALELRSMLGTLTSSNTRMKWIRRSAAVAAFLSPEALEAIQAELIAEVALQEGLRLKWRAEGVTAALGRSCNGLRVLPIRYPVLEWARLPPDPIGPQAFEWPESPQDPSFFILLSSSNHQSAAQVERSKDGPQKNAKNIKDRWAARWAGLR
jgi:hypothetical protein